MAKHQAQDFTDDPLLAQLLSLHEGLRDAIQGRWNRSLPFADQLLDRWERARHLGFGENASVYDSALVLGKVEVGENTWIGPNTVLDGSGSLNIGSFCSISAGVQIYTHDTVQWALTEGHAKAERKATSIGDRCYIGPHAVISKGVTIGSGSIVGAHSLVSNDIPAGSIALGVPARVRGRVEIKDGRAQLHYDTTS